MDVIGIDIAQIADLGTQIANTGAIRALEQAADSTFEYIVAMVRLVEQSGR